MKTLVIAAAIAIALIAPANAQFQNNFNQALQNYQSNQRLQDNMNQANQNWRESVNRGLDTMRPQPYGGCTSYNRSIGAC